jgi:hypothetical protein
MSERETLGTSLVTTLRSDEAVSIAADALELGIDRALADGLLKDLPVVGTLVSISKIGLTVRDSLFIQKLLRFLRELNDVPPKERQRMVEKLERDPGYGRNVGEHLIEILEKIDSHRKPEMTARVFAAYVKGSIDIRTLHRLNNAIERLPFYEIDSVRKIQEMSKAEDKTNASEATTYRALEGAGLMYAVTGFGGLVYRPSDLCHVFVDLDLDGAGI